MSTTAKATLRTFITSEDKAGFLRARRLLRQLETLSECQRVELRAVFWNFSLLRHAGLRECASLEAAASDMIVVSVHQNAEIPPHMQLWLESLPARADGHGALVALLGAAESCSFIRPSCVNYLRQIAESRGLDFICNQDRQKPAPAFEPDFFPFEQVPDRGLAPAGMSSSPIPWFAGDVNK